MYTGMKLFTINDKISIKMTNSGLLNDGGIP